MSNSRWLRDPQNWAVEQERLRNQQALYAYGEYVIVYSMWDIGSFHRGEVEHCSRCWLADEIAAKTYKQPMEEKCSGCFGTGFEGGYRARLVRPAVILESSETEHVQADRGHHDRSSVNVNIAAEFMMHNGDYMIRADNTRWQLHSASVELLSTGFAHLSRGGSAIGHSVSSATAVPHSSVAFMLDPVDAAEVEVLIGAQYLRSPQDFTDFEIIRAPLIPVGF